MRVHIGLARVYSVLEQLLECQQVALPEFQYPEALHHPQRHYHDVQAIGHISEDPSCKDQANTDSTAFQRPVVGAHAALLSTTPAPIPFLAGHALQSLCQRPRLEQEVF
jgi:hypothetical protein